MARLWYPDERAARILITTLTEGLAGDDLKMRLRGSDGRERLLSALAQPRWPQHRSLADKAAALHFFLNKGHPFVDGNKRFAVAAMETFLAFNGGVLGAVDDEIVDLALGVADGTYPFTACRAFVRLRMFRPDWSDMETARWVRRLDAEGRAQVALSLQAAGFERGIRMFAALEVTQDRERPV